MSYPIPEIQRAIQLVGPEEVILNESKRVFAPRSRQVLCQVEAVGLCFSDLKLVHQFASHPRKSEIISGIDQEVLKEIPSYVPGDRPTVLGHETAVRISAVGDEVADIRPGERYLVQTDYRWLSTASANAAFGYNLEGALQEFVLLDERVITSPTGETTLIPASEALSAAAIALVEPWACVEDSYAVRERQGVKPGGLMLVVADADLPRDLFISFLKRCGTPGHITWVSRTSAPRGLQVPVSRAAHIEAADDARYDDVVYVGASPDKVQLLLAKIGPHGLLNIVLCGRRLGRPVLLPVGRIHYGGIRIVGTPGPDPAQSLQTIPFSGEIRRGDHIHVVGAGGPMGMMHVIRSLCQGVPGVSVLASDTDDSRLQALCRIAAPIARAHGVPFRAYNPLKETVTESFDYIALMAPVPGLVAQAVNQAARQSIISIFAGIPDHVTTEIDLDAYIENQLYFIGTSGSVLEDMKAVLAKVEAGILDTNLSVAAVSGLEGAVAGLRAVAERQVTGKIIVYPRCRGLHLVSLEDMQEQMPRMAEFLDNGMWNGRAEQVLWEMWGGEK